jgi:hypothetical protein
VTSWLRSDCAPIATAEPAGRDDPTQSGNR